MVIFMSWYYAAKVRGLLNIPGSLKKQTPLSRGLFPCCIFYLQGLQQAEEQHSSGQALASQDAVCIAGSLAGFACSPARATAAAVINIAEAAIIIFLILLFLLFYKFRLNDENGTGAPEDESNR